MNKLFKTRELPILAVTILVMLFFSVAAPGFMSLANLRVILRSSAFTGIMACGVGFLLISGQIDVSIGRIAGLAAIVTAWLAVRGAPGLVAGAAGIATGVLVGLVNSFLTLRLRIPAFLGTIAMLFICQGLSAFLANGFSIYPLPADIGTFGSSQPAGLSWPFFVFLAIAAGLSLLLDRTVFGLQIRATGSDKEIAFMTEVPVNRMQTAAFALCGAAAGLSGVMILARIATGDSNIGGGYELNAITAAAIGGVSLFGYDGSMFGVVLGTFLIQALQNGLIQMGMSPYLQTVEIGLILLVSAFVDQKQRERLRL